MFNHIYVDLDGVLADFAAGVFELFDTSPNIPMEPGQQVNEAIGVSEETMWRAIKDAGHDWWVDLRPTEYCDALLAVAYHHAHSVCILSSPGQPEGAIGKMIWMNKHLGGQGYFNEFVLTPRKHLLSRASTLLIDDLDRNVQQFNERGGGHAVLVPQPWNSASAHVSNRIEYIADRISEIQ